MTNRELLSIIRSVFFTPVIFLAVFSFGLTGCSKITEKPSPEPVEKIKPIAVEVPEAPVEKVQSADMSAETMYKILLAEVLVKRGQPQPAYQLLSDVTKKTRDPGLAERNFQLSMATFDVDAIKESTDLWREISPEQSLPWKASFLMAVREGKQDQAFSYWQTYVEKSNSDLEPLLIEASVRVAQLAPKKEGLKFMKKLQETYPNEAVAYYAFGVSAEAYQEACLAIISLEKSAQLYREQLDSETKEQSESMFSAEKMYREVHLLLASAYLKSKQPRLGLEKLNDYVEDHPKDWELQEKYARLEVKAGQFAAAEKRYLRILENEPKAFTSRLSVALIQLERREYQQSIDNLKELQSVRRYKSTANYYLGVASYELGRNEQARDYFSQVSTDDYYLDAQLRIAEIDYAQKGLESTLAFIDKLEPKNNEQRIKLFRAQAVFYSRAGQKQTAVESYDQALNLAPKNVDLLLSQSMLLYDVKEYDKYQQNLQTVLKIEPNNADALNALGYFYVERKERLDEAKVLLDKALDLAPDRFYILDSRGWLAYQSGDYEEAESYLEKAFEKQVDDEVLIHLIQTKWQLGKQDDAVELWEDFHQRFPENERLQQLIKELSEG